MGCDSTAGIMETIENFDFAGEHVNHERYRSGHINDTSLIIDRDAGEEERYILQITNHEIFKNSVPLIKNVKGMTSFLREETITNGRDPYRKTLDLVRTKDDDAYYIDSNGNHWRAYLFTGGAICHNLTEKPEDFYQSGKAFGHFQRMLTNYPTKELSEAIPNFHNTLVWLETFKQAVKEDVYGCAADVREEIASVMGRTSDMGAAQTMLEDERLPLRVAHNNTKLNNIMINDVTGETLCIIGLDTIIPGLSIFDFGDSIRFGANTTEEDKTDLSRVSPSLPLFNIYTKGLLEGCSGSLTKAEATMLPMRAKLMILECGVRFLTDYPQGDTYLKIHREHHNLDRTKAQFGLMAGMEKKWAEVKAIVKRYQQVDICHRVI